MPTPPDINLDLDAASVDPRPAAAWRVHGLPNDCVADLPPRAPSPRRFERGSYKSERCCSAGDLLASHENHTSRHRPSRRPIAFARRLLSQGIAAAIISACVGVRGQGIPEPSLTLYGAVTNRASVCQGRLTSGSLVWRFIPSDGSATVVLTTQLTNINDQFSYRLRVPCEHAIGQFTVSTNTLKMVTPALGPSRINGTKMGWQSLAELILP